MSPSIYTEEISPTGYLIPLLPISDLELHTRISNRREVGKKESKLLSLLSHLSANPKYNQIPKMR